MAKAAAKSSPKTEPKKKPTATRAKAPANNIEKTGEDAVQILQELGIEEQLQHDLMWCLGSYRADGNPVGLYEHITKALAVLQNEKQKKTKGVTAKLVGDLEKIVKGQ